MIIVWTGTAKGEGWIYDNKLREMGVLSLFLYFNYFIFCIYVVILSDHVVVYFIARRVKILSSAPTPPKCY